MTAETVDKYYFHSPNYVDGSKKLKHVSGYSFTWFIFNLNTKQCYQQITHNNIYSHRYMYTHDDSLPTHPLLPSLISTCPSQHNSTPIFTYLEILLLLLVVRIPIHTLVPGLLSTVLPLLLHPPQGTPQIKLHNYIDKINNISLPL